MAIFVNTEKPAELVQRIRDAINNKNIDTWICDSAGDFTHDTDQWRFNAWIRPYIETGRVVFGIICRKDRNLSITDYAVYHGRFAEMLLRHFDTTCLSIEISPLGSKKYDTVNKAQ